MFHIETCSAVIDVQCGPYHS